MTIDGVDESARTSSRVSRTAAGWGCTQPGRYHDQLPPDVKRKSWLNPRMLWLSRNDMLARISDPVPVERARWVAGLTDEDLTVDLSDRGDDLSILLMGDTGEGDESQYALVTPLAAAAPGKAFLLICSDVLYPIGDVNDYENKFYRPYARLAVPIYAVPGNHDWYDSLHAFMYHFCGLTEQRASAAAAFKGTPKPPLAAAVRAGVRRWLWRKPAIPDEVVIAAMRAHRGQPAQHQPVTQPGPYYVIDTAQLRLICIDTGIEGDLDQAQGSWLLRVSRDPRPKVLVSGKPLYVDGSCRPCPIAGAPEGYRTVLEVVDDPAFRYVAAIGGDIHNYQRYPVRTGDRVVQHIVSGGGGAFMHATHQIPPIDPQVVPGVTEDDFRCYPLRRDSLAAYSRVLQGIVRKAGVRAPALSPDRAARYLSATRGRAPLSTRPVDAGQELTQRDRIMARSVLLLGQGRAFHKWFSPFYDWDTPPFFKHFLVLDVRQDGLTVTCHGVTGCGEHELEPPVEDRVEIRWR